MRLRSHIESPEEVSTQLKNQPDFSEDQAITRCIAKSDAEHAANMTGTNPITRAGDTASYQQQATDMAKMEEKTNQELGEENRLLTAELYTPEKHKRKLSASDAEEDEGRCSTKVKIEAEAELESIQEINEGRRSTNIRIEAEAESGGIQEVIVQCRDIISISQPNKGRSVLPDSSKASTGQADGDQEDKTEGLRRQVGEYEALYRDASLALQKKKKEYIDLKRSVSEMTPADDSLTDDQVSHRVRDLFYVIHGFCFSIMENLPKGSKIKPSPTNTWLRRFMPAAKGTDDETTITNALTCVVMGAIQDHYAEMGVLANDSKAERDRAPLGFLAEASAKLSARPPVHIRWVRNTMQAFKAADAGLFKKNSTYHQEGLSHKIKREINVVLGFKVNDDVIFRDTQPELDRAAGKAFHILQILATHPAGYEFRNQSIESAEFDEHAHENVGTRHLQHRQGARVHGCVFPGLIKQFDNEGEEFAEPVCVSKVKVIISQTRSSSRPSKKPEKFGTASSKSHSSNTTGQDQEQSA